MKYLCVVHGEKMTLMKKTLDLLVTRASLTASDRISFVTFDTNVKLDMPLTAMDSCGRTKCQIVIKALQPGSATNLSGGALKAIDVFTTDTAAVNSGRTRAVLLFTDGMATAGICDPAKLTHAVGGALREAATTGIVSLFTFGFGSDHNENVLQELSACHGSGGYYYVDSAEAIPNAFADCLGGLTSVVAQNAILSLEPLNGATITRVLGNTYSRTADGSLDLGDLYAEDEKDLLIELSLPVLPSPRDEPSVVLRGSLRSFIVARSAMEAVDATASVARPATTPASQPENIPLDIQRNRCDAAEAMDAASRLADQGDVEGGRALLQAARRRIVESQSAATPFVTSLVDELDTLLVQYVNQSQYREVGSKMSKMAHYSHARQRGVHMQSEVMYAAGAKGKAKMKRSWGLSE